MLKITVFFEFHLHLCLVKSQAINKVLLQGVVGVNGLYSFHNIKLQDNSPQLLSTSTLLQTIACLIQLLLLIDHMLPSHSSTSVYSPLELIFIDLWGPYHLTSYFGFKYCVSFIDAFSRYTWIFPIKTKAKTIFSFSSLCIFIMSNLFITIIIPFAKILALTNCKNVVQLEILSLV